MLKIVVFLNASQQRKYIEIVRSAMEGADCAHVQPVEIFTDDRPSNSDVIVTTLKHPIEYRPIRLFVNIILAILYVPYAVLAGMHSLYRIFLHKCSETGFVVKAPYTRAYRVRNWLRKMARRYKVPIQKLRKRISNFNAATFGRTSPGYRVYFALVRFRRKWSHVFEASMLRLAIRTKKYLRHRSIIYAALSDRSWQRYLDERLFSLRPDLIILLEDNAEGLTGLVSHTARKRRIPYVILPDYIPNPTEPARYYFNSPLHSADSFAGRLIRRLAPRWVFEYDGKQLLRLPSNAICVRLLRGQHCPQPWILNAGYADAIFLESRASMAHYMKLGFKPEKLKVIGGAIEDDLYALSRRKEAQRQAFDTEYGLDPKMPLVVCGFPPDQYTAATEGFEFRTYKEMCRSWFEALESITDRANVIVVRHPRLKAEVLKPYAGGNVKIADCALETILPISDLYVACISTTIRWALALGIPVINYDSYRYNYGDFSTALGCLEVTNAEMFRATLENILSPGELDNIKLVADADSGSWGQMDGMFRARLRNSLLEIRKHYNSRPEPTHSSDYRLEYPN